MSLGGNTPFFIGDGTNEAIIKLSGSPSFKLLSASAPIIISSNGTFIGYPSINRPLTNSNGGTLSPGLTNGPPLLVSDFLCLKPGSLTIMELNVATGSNDFLKCTGTLQYGGTLQITNLAGEFTNGSAFKIFNATNYIGAFENILPPSPGPNLRWDTNQLNVDGTLRVFAVPTPPPTIFAVTATSNALTINASNGIPYDLCYLLTSTNVASPLAEWSRVATNTFNASGSASFAPEITFDEPARYFRVGAD